MCSCAHFGSIPPSLVYLVVPTSMGKNNNNSSDPHRRRLWTPCDCLIIYHRNMRAEREIASCDVKEGPGGGEGDGPSISSSMKERRSKGKAGQTIESPEPAQDQMKTLNWFMRILQLLPRIIIHVRPSFHPSLPSRSTITSIPTSTRLLWPQRISIQHHGSRSGWGRDKRRVTRQRHFCCPPR